MMADNVMSSYLVSLGFHVDDVDLRKFNGTLRGVAHDVEFYTSGMAKEMFKWQTAIVSGFAAVGGAMLGLMDHVATADQGYRLMAMHMFMSKEATRALSLATDALGVSLQDAIWDPELRGRMDQLLADQRRMSAAFGGDFDAQAKRIRMFQQEWSRFKQEMVIGEYALGASLFKAIGGDNEDPLKKLQDWNLWIQTHGPEITKFFTDHLVPVWKDFVRVGKDVGVMLKDAGVAFTNIMGAISGDKGLEGNAFSFEKFATAIDHAANGMAKFVDAGTKAFGIVTNLASAGAEFLSGDKKDAKDSLHAAKGDVSKGSLAILGAALLGTIVGSKMLGRLGGKLFGADGEKDIEGIGQRGASPEKPVYVSVVSGDDSGGLGGLGEIAGVAGKVPGGLAVKGIVAAVVTGAVAGFAADRYITKESQKSGTIWNRLQTREQGVSDFLGKHNFGQGIMDRILDDRNWSFKTNFSDTSVIMVGGRPVLVDSKAAGGVGGAAAGGGSGLDSLANAIASAEGFGIAGAKPTRLHNPGDLTDASGKIRTFGTDAEGRAALMAQLMLIASGKSKAYGMNPNITLEQFGKKYTSTDQAAWLANVTKRSGFSKDTRLSDIANGTAVSVTINVAGTNATPEQIAAATKDGVHQALQVQHTAVMAEVQGGYAGGG
jgi:hypothetical protein